MRKRTSNKKYRDRAHWQRHLILGQVNLLCPLRFPLYFQALTLPLVVR